MPRWEPGARGRLVEAALELYAQRGYDLTPVDEIAERAGVTPRTFFRHFPDKREVLFSGTPQLVDALERAVAALDEVTSCLAAAEEAFVAVAAVLDTRPPGFVRERAVVVAREEPLRERELLRHAAMTTALADALVRRGQDREEAVLAAEVGTAAFRLGVRRWVERGAEPGTDDGSIVLAVREAFAALRRVAAG